LSFGWGLRFGFFRWIQMPAYAAFILWLILQIWTMLQQVSGFGNVSALAHLGGVLTGVAFWWLTREKS
jgi:membrane associated rhomboid family serine protease